MISSYYARHGGCSDYGDGCGVFCIHAYSAANTTGWFVGAALSFKLDIIIYYIHGETTQHDLSSHYLGRNTVGPTRTNCILHF